MQSIKNEIFQNRHPVTSSELNQKLQYLLRVKFEYLLGTVSTMISFNQLLLFSLKVMLENQKKFMFYIYMTFSDFSFKTHQKLFNVTTDNLIPFCLSKLFKNSSESILRLRLLVNVISLSQSLSDHIERLPLLLAKAKKTKILKLITLLTT